MEMHLYLYDIYIVNFIVKVIIYCNFKNSFSSIETKFKETCFEIAFATILHQAEYI